MRFADEAWTREETDHLFELARRYDLRFIVMADRWEMPTERSVDVRRDVSLKNCKRAHHLSHRL